MPRKNKNAVVTRNHDAHKINAISAWALIYAAQHNMSADQAIDLIRANNKKGA